MSKYGSQAAVLGAAEGLGKAFAIEAATKAFLKNFAEGLFHEMKGENVDITACCAGMIDTPGF